MAKRLDKVWVVIDKRRSTEAREYRPWVDGVFADRQAAYEHLDNIEATHYDRLLRDVVVVPFDALYEPPRFRDLWRIKHERSDDLNPAIPKEVRIFEHTDPKWFRADFHLPVVSKSDEGDWALMVTAEDRDECMAIFEETAKEHGVKYYKPTRRMPGALPMERQ